MPAAAPIPRGPSVLTLYSAGDLLTGHGCPICRYADEASDRYLGWFALEGCAQTEMITRLRRSLGMCPRHTRGLVSQPGAAHRLTAVNLYVLQAARQQLEGRSAPARLAACPACEHDDAAAGRALDTLIDGLAEGPARERYRELGGLCLPHLRDAAVRAPRRLAAWLAETALTAVTTPSRVPGWLAGSDHDAGTRAALRAACRARLSPSQIACAACLAAARNECIDLEKLQRSQRGQPAWPGLLCPGHLSDVALLAGRDGLESLLNWQANCLTAGLSQRAGPRRHRTRYLASRLWPRRSPPGRRPDCTVCRRRKAAATQALGDISLGLSAAQPDAGHTPVCVRHALALRTADHRHGQAVASRTAQRADLLIAELTEAFRKNTWAHRDEARGPEMDAWRQAAALLDGGVFCGRLPPGTTEP